MEPSIPTGSLCLLDRRVGMEEVRTGDVVAFGRKDGSMVLHRVAGRKDGELITKGDANEAEDFATVSEEGYLGRKAAAIPYLGYLAVFLQKRGVRTVAFMAAASFLLAGMAEKIFKKEEGRYEKT